MSKTVEEAVTEALLDNLSMLKMVAETISTWDDLSGFLEHALQIQNRAIEIGRDDLAQKAQELAGVIDAEARKRAGNISDHW